MLEDPPGMDNDGLNDPGYAFVVGAWPLSGVNQSSPRGPVATNDGTSNAAKVTVTSGANEIVFGAAFIEGGAMDGDNTVDWDSSGGDDISVGQREDGASPSVTLNWTNDEDKWVAIGVSIKPQ